MGAEAGAGVAQVPQVGLAAFVPDAREVIYCGLRATVLLGRSEAIAGYLRQYIDPNVTCDLLKRKNRAPRENPSIFRQANLGIRSG